MTPVKHFMRSATRDVELGGRTIAKDDWLMLCYPSGNRDESVFADPFVFDVARTPNRQLAFGYGAHVCIGQHLARMEMRILWEELLPRLDHVELAGEPQNMTANFVSGPKSVPIRFRMPLTRRVFAAWTSVCAARLSHKLRWIGVFYPCYPPRLAGGT